MRNKVLRPSTIIPPDLYVHRDADRQLRRVIEDMGRPAYVLVARQMGKTNLLLNAKREMQGAADAFVYIDLSNRFASAGECFRNIVDTALESHEALLGAARPHIDRLRGLGLPPHKEHERELRELLNVLPGVMVMFLDEVDSMTTTPFADSIFAQIRSVYFSRANISEYSRLTYVLSGVAEPSELIRNPKLSPFNIGEKIYLDDFTLDEFETLLEHAQLPLPPEVRTRVFEWTSGTPRMTWDVLSSVEDTLSGGNVVTPATIDSTVSSLYLTSFDRAPIDHIRTLTAASPELRSAVSALRRPGGALISDSAKSKLYLAGIVASKGSKAQFKNPIISESLSDQWLLDVETRRLGLFDVAQQQLESGLFDDAARSCSEFLAEGIGSDGEQHLARNTLSSALFALGRYSEALAAIQERPFDRTLSPSIYYAQARRAGLCHLYLRDYAAAIEMFRGLIDCEVSAERLSARINLASAYVISSPEQNKESILALYKSALDGLDNDSSLSAEARKELRVFARHNLASFHRQCGDTESARSEFALAQFSEDARHFLALGAQVAFGDQPFDGAKHKTLLSVSFPRRRE